jgi:hypothetical protein
VCQAWPTRTSTRRGGRTGRLGQRRPADSLPASLISSLDDTFNCLLLHADDSRGGTPQTDAPVLPATLTAVIGLAVWVLKGNPLMPTEAAQQRLRLRSQRDQLLSREHLMVLSPRSPSKPQKPPWAFTWRQTNEKPGA